MAKLSKTRHFIPVIIIPSKVNQTFRRVKDAAAKDRLSLRVDNTTEVGMLELFKKGRHYGRAT